MRHKISTARHKINICRTHATTQRETFSAIVWRIVAWLKSNGSGVLEAEEARVGSGAGAVNAMCQCDSLH